MSLVKRKKIKEKKMSEYQSISVRDAMNNIVSNKYLLPAIQRKFVWSIEQIETLFDSILRGYPINSFMLWEIKDKDVKQNYKFYQFLKDYVQKFGEDNIDAPTELLTNDFYAVIDGQQRLTSLYIGLVGSYKIKKPSKWWQADEYQTPMDKKRLYLEITKELESVIDNEKMYDFRFMSDEELAEEKKNNPTSFWFLVHDVLKFNDNSDVISYLIDNGLNGNKFAVTTLSNLYSHLSSEKLISYYIVDDQNQDKVLDVFIRTNSGGTPLSFSDLLMSIASANWRKYDAREEMKQTKESIYSYGNPNFNVSQDFILKTILVLSDGDLRFKIENFGRDNIEVFEEKWPDIKNSLIATFKLLASLNFNDTMLRAKNAAIPIAYYIYKNNLADEITKSTYDADDRKNISKWLSMSLLKGMFGGTSDSVLKTMRDVIKAHIGSKFPFSEIVDEFKSNPDRNYLFTDDIIVPLLTEQYGTGTCGIVLNLLYPDVVLRYGGSVAEDHMHPKTVFEDKTKLAELKLDDDKLAFYKDKNNYNSCLNLQLLETTKNGSKLNSTLKDWAKENNIKNNELYIGDEVSLDINSFPEFIKSRKDNLLQKLKELLS